MSGHWTHPVNPQAVRVSEDGRVATLLCTRVLVEMFRDLRPYGYRHGDGVKYTWVQVSAPNGVFEVTTLQPEDVEGWTELYHCDAPKSDGKGATVNP